MPAPTTTPSNPKPTYKSIGFLTIEDRGPDFGRPRTTAFECDLCGTCITDTAKHNKFHENLPAAANK